MKLYIWIKNLEIAKNLKKYLMIDSSTLENKFKEIYFWEVENEISPQYKLFLNSIKQIKKEFGNWEKLLNSIEWFYIGNEQCEFLMPTKEEFIKMIEVLKKDFWTKKKIILVTSYFGNLVVQKRLKELLKYIDENTFKMWWFQVEVVVNSVWTIQMIKELWLKKIKVIRWTLLTKHFKSPVFELFEWNALSIPWRLMKNKTEEEKKEIYKKILDNNLKEFNRAVWHNEYFIKLLKKYWINRVEQYWLKEYDWIFKWVDSISLDIYYPYILTTTGRACHTSQLKDSYNRWYYADDKVCSKTCTQYNMLLNNWDDHTYKLHQFGNAIYKIYNDVQLNLPAEFKNKNSNRIIYYPFL